MTLFRNRFVRRSSLALAATIFTSSLFAQDGPAKGGVGLQRQLEALAERAKPGRFGIAVVDLSSGGRWGVDADKAFPMMSDFKAPVAAAVLARVDAGTLTRTQRVTVRRSEVVEGSAIPSIGEKFVGEQMSFTVDRLLTAAVSESDNTAVDALIRLLGGPDEVTRFLAGKGIAATEVTMPEGGIAGVFENLHGAAGAPKGETAEQEDARRRGGYTAYVTTMPNRTTPNAAALFLAKLWRGELLSHDSTARLEDLMAAQTVPRRMREGVPANARFADKTGTSATVDGMVAAYNDMGVISWPDGHVVIVTGFLSGSTASKTERDALFAELARTAAAALRHPGE